MLVAPLFLCGKIVETRIHKALEIFFYCFMGTKLLFLQIVIKTAETNDNP